MQRYFIQDESNWSDHRAIISGTDVHHILRVMRKRLGDQIICVHPRGEVALCTIEEIVENRVIATIDKWLEQKVELPIDVTIVQGLPKGDKLDYILQKGTELGASQFVLFKAERSVVNWDHKKIGKKLQRFEKILKEASEQSHRQIIPSVHHPVDLKELTHISKSYDFKVFAYEEEAKSENYQSFANVLKQMNPGMRLLICIGPEGGFTLKEAEELKEQDFHAVRFGPRILRTETAGFYALSSISYHFEELRWSK